MLPEPEEASTVQSNALVQSIAIEKAPVVGPNAGFVRTHELTV
jgi:hypothetical protein